MTRFTALLFAFLLAAPLASAADFSGQFRDDFETGATISLQSDDDGGYSGQLTMDGYSVPLTGNAEGEVLAGEMNDSGETIAFRARLSDSTLVLNLMDPDFPGEVMETLRFERAGNATVASSSAAASSDGEVTINGRTLSADEVAGLAATYGVEPLPGNYWYDAMSGLYGVVGYQAYSYMYPGHEFGQLDPNVSAGDTGVYVNGRHLPQSEWVIWSYMLGAAIDPGYYWLDAQGNAGYVGNPIPTVNLFMAAQQNAYQGQGGGGSGGDNSWSTRFSAGNSNADNTQGYVSVPGHGPIGYGF